MNKITETSSLVQYLIVSVFLGLTYKIDLRPYGFEIHNMDLQGTIITILIFCCVFFYLHSKTVKETYMADGD